MRTLPLAARFCLVLALLAQVGHASAQAQADPRSFNEEELDALAAAQALLDVINTRDASSAHELLLPDGALVRVLVTEEGGDVQAIPHRTFVRTIGGPGPTMLERIWDPRVMVHGPIAIVWAPYEFHADDAFSHCGINAFSLVRSGREWKVAGVIYTVEYEDCAGSPFAPLDPTPPGP
jgi:hypothetical protein